MPQCIFCEGDDLPEDTQECPNCGNKPFSGMYFDPEQFAMAQALKQKEKWRKPGRSSMKNGWPTTRDYFDEEMGDEINVKLLELFERQPSLVEQYELCKQTMEIQFYYAYFF